MSGWDSAHAMSADAMSGWEELFDDSGDEGKDKSQGFEPRSREIDFMWAEDKEAWICRREDIVRRASRSLPAEALERIVDYLTNPPGFHLVMQWEWLVMRVLLEWLRPPLSIAC